MPAGVDFPFTGYPITYPPYALTRARAYDLPTWGGPSFDCAGCHGYPPRGEFPSLEAAAGESHAYLTPEGWEDLHIWNHGYDPVPCRTCHFDTVTDLGTFARDVLGVTTLDPIPIGAFDMHVNGAIDIAFDTVNPTTYSGPIDLSTATWDPVGRTCTDVGCHLNQTVVEFGAPYRTNNAAECNACHQF